MNAILFEEKQAFRQTWLWLLLGGTLALMLAGLLFSQQPEAVPGLAIGFSVLLATALLLWFMKLSVRVEGDAVHVRFWPIVNKTIALADITRSQARTYRPILEYGGWGIRYSFANGWAYNVSGKEGVQL